MVGHVAALTHSLTREVDRTIAATDASTALVLGEGTRRRSTHPALGYSSTRVRSTRARTILFAKGTRAKRESPVLTRSTKIVPLSFEPGSSATNLSAAHGAAAGSERRTHARTHRGTLWTAGLWGAQAVPYYRDGTGPPAPARRAGAARGTRGVPYSGRTCARRAGAWTST